MIFFTVGLLGVLQSDGDAHGRKQRTQPLPGEPAIREVKPASARVGERVKIEGENFGGGVPVVTFSGLRASVIKAEDDELRVIVPEGAETGPLVITVGGRSSRPVHFVVAGSSTRRTPSDPVSRPSPDSSTVAGAKPPTDAAVSFSKDIQPLFTRSCTDCHGGSAGMFLDEGESYGNLVNVPATKGCTSEMRVKPGDPDASVLYKRLTGSSCGAQMPKKAPPLAVEEIALIRRWIESGAPNN